MSEDNVVDVEGSESPEKMSIQEQNWRLMTILQIPWHHANQISDEADREFLLNKATEVEGFLQMQQQQQQQQQMQQQPEPSPIITPN